MARPSYCSTCGSELTDRRIEGRERAYCPSCAAPVYRNPKPAAGVLVVEDDSVLLIERTNPPAVGHWSIPAGYLEVEEPPRAAAARELHEETGVDTDPDALRLADTQFVTTGVPDPVLVVVYTVPAEATEGTPSPGSDAAAARFWERSALAEIPLEPGYKSVFEQAIDDVQGRGGSPS